MLRVSSIRRPAVAATLALGFLAASILADGAGAQEVPGPSSSEPAASTSVTEPAAEPTTAPVPTSVLAPDTTAPSGPEETAAPSASTSAADSTTTLVPPPPADGVVEGQTESVPIVAPAIVDLPVRGSRPARVVAGVATRVTALIRAATDANTETLAKLSDAEMRNAAAQAVVDTAQQRVDRLSVKERAALSQLAEARSAFEQRVRWAYTRGPTATLEGFLQSRDAAQLTDRRAMVQFVLEGDADAINRYLSMRDSVDAAVSTADDILSGAEREHATTQIEENSARADAALTTMTVGFWNRAKRGLRDLVFPVMGAHTFGSDFGAPRMVGTPDEHTHEGNDIVAPLGAQLVAVEPGMIVAMGTDRLGGIKLWLAGRSGTYYYYAHLSRFADNVHEGDIVPAGTVVGFVGNTGNAKGGIPHLHFEIHPNGGPAVDPYPYLAAADRRQKLEKWP